MPEPGVLEAGPSLILSIRPRHAEAILSGRKQVELRRKRPNVSQGALAFIYVSSPVKAVLGAFYVDQIISAPIESLWESTRNQNCINRDEYNEYFCGVSEGHAIQICGVISFRKPITLELLRLIWPGFRPPQSFGYFLPDDTYARRCLSILRRYCLSRAFRARPANTYVGRHRSVDHSANIQSWAGSTFTAIARRYLSMRPGTPARQWLNRVS